MFFWEHVVCKLPPPPSCIRCLCYKRRLFSGLPDPTASLVAFRLPATDKHERPDAASGHHYSGFSKMSSKKPFPNGEAAPEGSVGRHGNRWTNGIFMALSGLAAVVSFVALLFMVRELASIRDQQMAIMTDLQGLKDQVLQMQLKQEKEAEDKTASMTIGPDGPPGDVRSAEDHSATFWKSAEMHRRSKRDTLDNKFYADMDMNVDARLDLLAHAAGEAHAVHPETKERTGRTDNKARPVCRARPETRGGTGRTDNRASPVCKARSGLPDSLDSVAVQPQQPRLLLLQADCAANKAAGHTTSGVYTLGSPLSGVTVYCDMDTDGGGWTVIQRRMDGSVPFNKNWEEYKHGFGNKNGEYWLGNEIIHLLTAQKNYRLRVDMMDWENQKRYAEYDTFRVAGESDGYRLTISGYSGNANDDMTYNNEQRFYTIDRDSSGSCSQNRAQAGFWFKSCTWAHPNGRYLGNCGNSCDGWQGNILLPPAMDTPTLYSQLLTCQKVMLPWHRLPKYWVREKTKLIELDNKVGFTTHHYMCIITTRRCFSDLPRDM
ncbi:Fibrinogen- domains (FReDs) [Branchiostoma belcheri]|nr:Fibrinogen- domains (FReDs) [Branchiostoma belcheri]